jgi:putative DNA primase/helicase
VTTWETIEARVVAIVAMAKDERDAAIASLLMDTILLDVALVAVDAPTLYDAFLLRHRKGLGVSGAAALKKAIDRHIEQVVEDREDAARRAAEADRAAAPPPPTLDVVLEASMPKLVVPGGWTCNRGGIWKLLPSRDGGTYDIHVARRPMIVSGVLRDLETGERSLVVEWAPEHLGAWGRAIVDASETQDPRLFLKLRDLGAPVSGRNSRDLAEWLDHLEERNAGILPRAHNTTRLGWAGPHGELGFLWGKVLLREGADQPGDLPPTAWSTAHVRLAIPDDDGRAQIASACHTAGTEDGWRAAIGLVLEQPRVLLGVYAALASVFLGIIPDAPNAIVDWSGETSRGKTTTLRIAASCWGRPDGLMGTWDVSPAALESLAEMSCHMPLILDDTKKATTRGGDGSIVASIIYQVGSGKGRGRGRPDGMRRTATWRVIVLSTGEAPATSFTQDAGARARVLSLGGSPLPENSARLVQQVTEAISANYGHAGPAVVRWLLARRDAWPKIRAKYLDRVRHWGQEAGNSPVADRLGQILALIELGATALHDILKVPRPKSDPMVIALAAAVRGADDADRPTAAMAAVYDWAIQHEAEFFERAPIDRATNEPRVPARGWAGVWRDTAMWTEIAFVPDCLTRVLEHLGFDPDDIIPRWLERGWMPRDGKNRGLQRTIAGHRSRLLVIPRQSLENAVRVELPRGPDPNREGGNTDQDGVLA